MRLRPCLFLGVLLLLQAPLVAGAGPGYRATVLYR